MKKKYYSGEIPVFVDGKTHDLLKREFKKQEKYKWAFFAKQFIYEAVCIKICNDKENNK